MSPLILASASPRRRELLERVGIALEVIAADVDETPHAAEPPRAYVARIADAKALAIARPPGRWVLAADTTVTIDGMILGKAEAPEEAATMLRALSGRVHEVITAFAIVGDGVHERGVVATVVVMVAFDALDYVASGEWRGKAGAYAIQGIGAGIVRAVRGSVTNVIGLPLVEVLEILRAVGAPSARFDAGVPA